jgi:hypothetical protein
VGRGRPNHTTTSPTRNKGLAFGSLVREKVSLVRDKSSRLEEAHVRLFADSVLELKKLAAEKGTHWQIELRQLVRQALRGERREITIVRD